jgi:hypothetical protein
MRAQSVLGTVRQYRLRLLLIAALSLLVCISLILIVHRKVAADRASFVSICAGMSQNEVETILGGPPGDYTTRPTVFYSQEGQCLQPVDQSVEDTTSLHEEIWFSDDGAIMVRFDDKGHAVFKLFDHAMDVSDGPFNGFSYRIKRMLHACLQLS